MDKFLDVLLNQSPMVVMAIAAVYFLRQDQKALEKKHDDLQDELLDEREKRVTEQKEATAAVRESNNALKETVAALRSMRSSKSVPPTSGNG